MWKCKSQERDVWVSSWGRHYIKDLKTDHLISIIQYLRWRAAKELNLTKKGPQVFDEFRTIPYKRMRADITRYLRANVIPWSCLVDEYAKRIGLPYWVRPGIEDWKKRYVTGVTRSVGRGLDYVIFDESSQMSDQQFYEASDAQEQQGIDELRRAVDEAKTRAYAKGYGASPSTASSIINESRISVIQKTLTEMKAQMNNDEINRRQLREWTSKRILLIEQHIEKLFNEVGKAGSPIGQRMLERVESLERQTKRLFAHSRESASAQDFKKLREDFSRVTKLFEERLAYHDRKSMTYDSGLTNLAHRINDFDKHATGRLNEHLQMHKALIKSYEDLLVHYANLEERLSKLEKDESETPLPPQAPTETEFNF